MTEAEIRAAHPDWTDEQVAAEVTRIAALPPETPPAPPTPTPPADPVRSEQDRERDRAMAEMRRRAEAAEKLVQEAKTAEQDRERKQLEEQNRWEDIARKAEADKAELEAKIAAKDAEAAIERARSHAQQTAAELKFKDTGYALYKLDQDKVDLTDAAAVKDALETLARAQPDLLTVPPPVLPSGGPPAPGGVLPPGVTKTLADINAMSVKELRAFRKANPDAYGAALASTT